MGKDWLSLATGGRGSTKKHKKDRFFVDGVKRAFAFLVEDYGFRLVSEEAKEFPIGEGEVSYHSATHVLRVLLDRWEVTVVIGLIGEPPISQMALGRILGLLGDDEIVEQAGTRRSDDYQALVEHAVDQTARQARRSLNRILDLDKQDWIALCRRSLEETSRWYRDKTGLDYPGGGSLEAYLRSIDDVDTGGD